MAAVLVVAGTAAAFLLGARRDVTTSSDEAYRLYRQGRENELKLYRREAMADYAEALSHDPHFVMATVRLAGAMMGKDPARSRSLLECASRFKDEITPRERLRFEIAWARVVDKNSKAAEEKIEEYRRLFPNDPEGFELKANVLMGKGKNEEAMAEYEKLIAANPNYAIAYNVLGYQWMARRDWSRTEDYLKRYRFLAPDQANPFDSLGELYANTGRYAEAEESLKKALAVKPDFYAPIGHLGTMYVGMGNYRAAADQFRKAAEATGDEHDSREFRLAEALSLQMAGDSSAALAKLDELDAAVAAGTELSDEAKIYLTPRLGVFRSFIYVSLGRLDDAEKALAAVKLPEKKDGKPERPDDAQAVAVLRALIDVRRGKGDAAGALSPKSLPSLDARAGSGFEYFPARPVVWVVAAQALADAGQVGEAADLLKGVLALNPKFQPALDALARVRGEAAPAVSSLPPRTADDRR